MGKSVPRLVVPESVSENGCDDVKEIGDWKGLRGTVKLTIWNEQAQTEVVSSASALIIKTLKEPPRDRKQEKTKENKHTR